MEKILILRFSSIGDVVQALSLPAKLREKFPKSRIHFATRLDLAPLVENHPDVQQVWRLERREGFRGLFRLIEQLRKQNFTHIYDAHGSLRSRLICWSLHPWLTNRRLSSTLRLVKPSRRWWRFLLFRFRINRFEQPFSGQRDLLEPLEKWGLNKSLPPTPQLHLASRDLKVVEQELQKLQLKKFVVLCPSATYPLKRWPLGHWSKLIQLCPEVQFVLLGGVHDRFLTELVSSAPERVVNFAGRLSLLESAAMIEKSQVTIANDTGLLHMAEQLGQPAIALMGPAPFGFPSRPRTQILQLDLPCRPCSKHGQGPCTNPSYQQCLVGLEPEQVAFQLKGLLAQA